MLFGDSWPALHGAVTHFPVALLLTAAFFDFCAIVFKKPKLRESSLWVLGLAVVSAIPTIITGRLTAGLLFSNSPNVPPQLNDHVLFAYCTSGLALLLLIWRLAVKDKFAGAALYANVLVSFVVGGMVAVTGHLGGQMVFGENQPAPVPAAANPLDANLISSGSKLYTTNGCGSCHSINGVGGHNGPDLTHEGTRQSSVDWQIAHLKNPASKSPGSTMPPYASLTDDQLKALGTYLVNLK